MDTKERGGGPRDEDSDLVDCIVGWIEGTVMFKGTLAEREQESGRNALVDGIFGNIDK